MSNYVQPTEYINYISEFKKILVNRNNGQTNQLFKIDSNISDEYYFQIVSKNNQIVDLSGRTFQIYGSLEDAKNVTHILFYTPSGTIEANNVLHFHINTYNQQYLNQIKTNKQANITIVETTNGDTQVVLRDVCLCYKRPYIDNYVPAEIYTVQILTGTMPWVNEFGAGQNINLIEGTPNFAFGSNLSTANNQFVVGDTNTPDATKAFIVANSGNVFTVDYEGNVEAASITVNGSQVATNADLTGFATEEWVNEQGFLTEHQDLTAYATKEWVEGKNYLTGVNLEPYATKEQLSLSAANLSYQISQLALDIPTKTSDLTNDSGFITGYTAGSGIAISNQNVISIDGELGKTYYADDTTLQLNEANNTFSVKSIRSKLNNGPGISLTEDGNGVVTITNTGGGGSGGYVYTAGTGLGLSAVTEGAEYQFYVDEAWFDQHIDAYTSGIQNLSAGTGLKIEDNVISLTAQIPSIDGLASEQWVEANFLSAIPSNYATKDYVDSSISGKADLSSVYTKEEVYTYLETDAKINQATSGKADLSAVQAVDDKFANYYTSAQVDQAIADAVDDIPSTVYTGEDGIKVENGVISLTATIPSTVAQLEDAGNYVTDAELNGAISAFITSGDIPTEKTKLSQFNNDVGFITSTSIPDTTGFATKTELSNTSTAIVAQIPDVTGFATEADLQIVSAAIPSVEGFATESELESVSGQLTNAIGNKANSADLENYVLTSSMSAYATSAWVIDQGYITGITNNALLSDIKTYTAGTGLKLEGNEFSLTAQIPSLDNYYNKTEVDTALALKANAADVYDKTNTYTKTEVNAISTALSSTVSGAGYLTEHQSLTDYYTKTEVNTITGTLEREITGKVAQSDFNSLCTAFSGAIDGKTTSSEVKTQIEAYGYQTATDVANAIAGKADTATVNDQFTATSTYIGEVSGNLQTAIGTATNDMATQTWVGQQIADFITADDLSGLDNRLTAIEADYTTSGQVSSIVNTAIAQIPGAAEYDAGTGLQRVFDSNTNKYVFSLTGTILTGGTNIEVVGDAINFTGTIPTTVAELSDHANYVLTSSMSAYATSAWVTEQGYITGIANNALISDVTSAINEISGVISTDYALKTNVANEFTATSTYIDTVSGNLHNEIAGINIPTSLSQLTNDEGFISSLVFESQDDEYQDVSISATSVYVDSNNLSISDNGNNQVYLSWKGVGIDGGVDSTEQFNAHWIYFDDNFSVESDEDGASISLATTIPTKTSDLNNDSGFATATDVTNAISASSGAIINGLATNDWVTNTVSSSLQTAINGKADSSAIPTAVSDLTNDSGFATTGYVTGQVNNLATGAVATNTTDITALKNVSGDFSNYYTKTEADAAFMPIGTTIPQLSSVYDLLSGVNIDISQAQDGVITLSAGTGGGGGATYTAGTGISIVNDEISVTGMVTTEQIANYTTKTYVDTTFLSASQIANYYTSAQVEERLSAVSATVTGLIPDDAHISAIASGYAGSESGPTNKQIVSSGFTYDPSIQIYKNQYTPTDSVVTLSEFTVPAGSLAENEVATFEEWVYVKQTITGFAFDNIILIGEVPSAFTSYTYYIFTRRINNDGTQLISFAYQLENESDMPLTFKAVNGNATIALDTINSPPSINLSTSTDGGSTWTSWNRSNLTIPEGTTVMLSGNNTTLADYWNRAYKFVMTGQIEAKGNVMSLLNFSNSCTNYCFVSLFNSCASLITAPLLPATTLAQECYQNMFYNCTNLKTAPKLPATTLATYCYGSMFRSCSSLTAAPTLPATTLAYGCYQAMFQDCSGLVVGPSVLPATTLYNNCYKYMFYGCSSLTKAPVIMATNGLSNTQVMNRIFQNCSSLSNIEVRFTSWPDGQYGTIEWIDGVAANGTFKCPTALGTNASISRGTSYCPQNWTVENI